MFHHPVMMTHLFTMMMYPVLVLPDLPAIIFDLPVLTHYCMTGIVKSNIVSRNGTLGL
jgi:hypothetical protein